MPMQKITPSLTFNKDAEAAIELYVSIFPDSKIVGTTRFGKDDFGPEGSVATIMFELFGERYLAVNGGDDFKFSEGISLYVSCDTQKEIDDYWGKLSKDGKTQPCGWVTDKFGVSWQITAAIIEAMMLDPDPEKVDRVNKAIYDMEKVDIKKLKEAYEAE